MTEQDWNPVATKFISSLVKFLQILCNSKIDFSESIELVGHIHVRIDHKYKFECIVDEQLFKEGDNTAINLISSSYHSCPSSRQTRKICELNHDVIFTELLQNMHEKPKTNHDCLSQSQGLQAEDILVNEVDANVSYSVTVGSLNKQEIQTNHMVVTMESDCDSNDCMFLSASLGGDYEPVLGLNGPGFQAAGPNASFEERHSSQIGHAKKCQQPNGQGMSNIKLAQPGPLKHEGTKHRMKKTSPLFSCQEYLAKYSSHYAKKNKHSSKQEMMDIFSDLAKKYGVAITIKPAKFTAQTVSSTKLNNISLTTTTSSTPLHNVVPQGQEMETSSGRGQVGLQHTNKALIFSNGTKIDNNFNQTVNQLSRTSATQSLQTESQITAVITANPRTLLSGHTVSYSYGNQTLIQEPEYDIKDSISNNIILSDTLIPLSVPEILPAVLQTEHRVIIHETSSSDIPCVVQKLVQSSEKRLNDSQSKITSRIANGFTMSDYVESDTPSSSLLNAIAVALAAETNSSDSSTFHHSAQECLRQQPMPKRHRENYLLCLRKEEPECYERYKCLSKEEQARERRHLSETNRDPNLLEKKSLMNRVLYFRRVNKLPLGLRDKSNDEIRCMSVDDLKKFLPPTKSLKNMDPIAKEEWYRLGRSREWRHRKKLLDPEGFKRYNNERAKRYQENLRKNNPEKYKEMRAKGADRLRQYRFSQRIMKAMKEGREIKISDSVPIAKKLTQVCGRRNETVIEVQEGDEELLIQDNIDKAHYVIPECATTHGEAATGRESSSARTDHPAQPDILDLMYNY